MTTVRYVGGFGTGLHRPVAAVERHPPQGSWPGARGAVVSIPASNGIEALSADKIMRRAEAALTEAKSFRAKGTLNQDDFGATVTDLKAPAASKVVDLGKLAG